MASPAADFATRYARGFTVGLVVILVIWHGGYDLVLGLAHLDEYRLWPVEVGAWVAMAVVVAAASARALRGTAAGRSGSWLLAGVTLAAGVAATLACPSEALIDADWAWGGMGWVAVLVLHRRPLREFVATLLLANAVVLVGLALVGQLDRVTLSRYVTVLYAAASIQLLTFVTAGAINEVADRAAADATSEALALARRRSAEEVHRARLNRYSTVQRAAAPLLAALARGNADPGSDDVRTRAALEAARLRRLLAESDDVPDKLIHELRSCAEIADRKGVVVDFEVAGAVPALPDTVRRALAEAPAAALATATSWARLAVLARPDEVAVSVLADTDHVPEPGAAGSVVVSTEREGGRTWVEARWKGRRNGR